MILPVPSRSCGELIVISYHHYICNHLEHDGGEDDGDHGAGEHDAEGVRDWHVGDSRQGSDEGQGGHGALQHNQHLLTAWPG